MINLKDSIRFPHKQLAGVAFSALHGHPSSDRPGHDQRYAMDIPQIKEEIGWFPMTDFVQDVAQTVAWYVPARYCFN